MRDNGSARHTYLKIHTTLFEGKRMRWSQMYFRKAVRAAQEGRIQTSERYLLLAEAHEDAEKE